MNDQECVQFLQWALPRLRLRWPGFRKVRRQICKRVQRRLVDLGLGDLPAYRGHLEQHPEEWPVLGRLCHVTISRFYRDRGVFQYLEQEVLGRLAARAQERGDTALRVWSAGCGSGEEPYTVALVWHLAVAAQFPSLDCRILATDAYSELIDRGREACYRATSLKDLPPAWREHCFEKRQDQFRLLSPYRESVQFVVHDIRTEPPSGLFDLVLCRNLAFTYFQPALQLEVAERFHSCLRARGALVIGGHESLPADAPGFEVWSEGFGVHCVGGDGI
jgi:chemotaxis protein methyltransferase CheR